MYTDKVIEHFQNPKNIGEIENPDGKATEGSMACGDMISMYIKVDDKSKKITDIKFRSYGCAANIATCSAMTELAMGKTIQEAKHINFKDVAEALGGLPPIKMHCAVLAIDALRSAIRNYEEKHGLAQAVELSDSLIRSRLRHVMHPKLGINIVSAELVDRIELEDGVVKIGLIICEDDEFQKNIVEEIRERVEHIPGVKKLELKIVNKVC